MNLITDIFNKKKQQNFSELDLCSIDLLQYQNILVTQIQLLLTSQTLLQDCNLIISFISCFSEQNKDKIDELENIHYNIIVKWIKNPNPNHVNWVASNIYLLPNLIKLVSTSKLNFYNEWTQESILDILLSTTNAPQLLPLMLEHGLEITSVKGLNPYYWALKFSSNNLTIEILHSKNVPLPSNYWPYLFNNMCVGTISKSNNFLLSLNDRQFIIDDVTKECVWHKIITSSSFDLIPYIPESFYKPYVLNKKTLIDHMVSNKSIISSTLLDNIFKLSESDNELYNLWDIAIPEFYFRLSLISIHYDIFKKIILETDFDSSNETLIKARTVISHFDAKYTDNPLQKIFTKLFRYFYEIKKNENSNIVFSQFESLPELMAIYHELKSSEGSHIYEDLTQYLNSLPEFNLKAIIQKTTTTDAYKNDYDFISKYQIDAPITSPKLLLHFKEYFAQLTTSQKELFLDSFITETAYTFNNTLNMDELFDGKKETNEVNDKTDKTVKPIEYELFSDASLLKFQQENISGRNEIASGILAKIKKNQKSYQKKSMAQSSELLKNIDNLYETFPHFEPVISHIENLMVLQNKGDKSFYIPPLLLGGGPGVGKTFFCHTLSKLVNTSFDLLHMESMTANFIITGNSAHWAGADTGKVFKTLFNEDNPNINPIILLDELDKAVGSESYGVMNCLLPLLEKYTAKNFKDECVALPIDASYINWFATANDLEKLTPPIKSRFDIFTIPNPTPIQRKALIKAIYQTVRLNSTWGSYFDEQLPAESLDILANLMAPGAARDLRKSIVLACSKAIRADSPILLPQYIETYDTGEILPWDIQT